MLYSVGHSAKEGAQMMPSLYDFPDPQQQEHSFGFDGMDDDTVYDADSLATYDNVQGNKIIA